MLHTNVLRDSGTEAQRDGTSAALYFFDRQRSELVRRVGMEASVSALLWHERLNQIFVGTGRFQAHAAVSYMVRLLLLSAAP